LVFYAWFFGAIWMYLTSGAPLTQYAKGLRLGGFEFGLLAALPYLGALAQFPGSFLIERYGRRKAVFLGFGIAQRLVWGLIALIPWALPDRAWPAALLILVTLSAASGHLASPAFVSWMADLVPYRLRGRYFSRRSQLGQAVGIVVTLVIGYLLDRAQLVDRATLLRTISIAFAAGAVVGAVDYVCFVPVPAREHRSPDRRLSLAAVLRQPLANRSFRRFLGFNATLTFGIGYIGQFIWLYLLDVVGMDNMQANLMLVVVPGVVTMTCYPLWGRLVDRLGRRPVLIIACLLIVHGALAWIFVRKDNWWLGYLAALLATAAWPGIEVASFNLILGMIRSKGDERSRGSSYVAINSLVVAGAGMLSGLFGGAVAHWLGNAWRGTFLGWPLTYHGVLFLISGGLRLASLAWLIGLEDPHAYGTRAAVRYMAANIYSNVQQALFMPTRGIARRLRHWSYSRNGAD